MVPGCLLGSGSAGKGFIGKRLRPRTKPRNSQHDWNPNSGGAVETKKSFIPNNIPGAPPAAVGMPPAAEVPADGPARIAGAAALSTGLESTEPESPPPEETPAAAVAAAAACGWMAAAAETPNSPPSRLPKRFRPPSAPSWNGIDPASAPACIRGILTPESAAVKSDLPLEPRKNRERWEGDRSVGRASGSGKTEVMAVPDQHLPIPWRHVEKLHAEPPAGHHGADRRLYRQQPLGQLY